VRRASGVLWILGAYFGVGLVYGVFLILTGTRSDYHWLGTLMAAVIWWPGLLVGNAIYFFTHR
jgi:hypothetical protein